MTLHSQDTVESTPTRLALVSDVHGNLPAFQAVLDDVRDEGVDEIWCLGDLVGYGAQPEECVALARETCSICLAGNHDLVVTGDIDIADFSRTAAVAALWTRDHMGQDAMAFLRALDPKDDSRSLGLYHASPRDPVWEYVLSTGQADDCMRLMQPRVGAVGHSHVALFFHKNETPNVVGSQTPGGTRLVMSDGRWLINPGGVGQPRDGDPRAAWLLLDTETWTATWRRVEYPIDDAARAIEEAGLPTVLGERLYNGQ
jgi:diadenosine tetraphosphatase ApaH/serine/threonine PP2A family protein phosphatase